MDSSLDSVNSSPDSLICSPDTISSSLNREM